MAKGINKKSKEKEHNKKQTRKSKPFIQLYDRGIQSMSESLFPGFLL
jgi:hypothetical protein